MLNRTKYSFHEDTSQVNCWPDTTAKSKSRNSKLLFLEVRPRECFIQQDMQMILVFVFYLLYAVFNCCTVFCRDAVFVEQTLGHGDAEALEVLEGVWSSLEDIKAGGQRPTSWEDCVTWARCKWETLYNNDIRQLLHCFPPDQVKLHQSKNSPHTAVISVYGHRGALLCTSGP